MVKKLMLLVVIMLYSISVYAMDVTLQWDTNTEPDLAGYKIYYDTDNANPPYAASGSPITITLADDQNPEQDMVEYTVSNLPEIQHWFCVSAYDNEGLESGYSNVVYTGHWPGGPPEAPRGLTIKIIVQVGIN